MTKDIQWLLTITRVRDKAFCSHSEDLTMKIILTLENGFNNGISSLRHFDKHFECHNSKHHVWQVVKPLPTQDQKG